MPRVGFTTGPVFEEVSADLYFYREYTRVVQYQAEIGKAKTSIYVPIAWFGIRDPDKRSYPDVIRMTLTVPPGTRWRERT